MKKKHLLVLGALAALVITGFSLYKLKIGADALTESLNPDIKLSQIQTTGEIDNARLTDAIDVSIPKGEKEAVAVLLENKSGIDYNNLTIEKDDLVSNEGGVISKDNIDERVIHNWQQKLIDWNSPKLARIADPVEVDELLVKNEKPSLTPPTDVKYNGDPFFSNDIGPELGQLLTSGGSSQRESSEGSTEKIKTSVAQSQSKKFHFSINIPEDSRGAYAGYIKFVDRSNNQIVSKLKLTVNSLPYKLVSQSQANETYQTGCYFNDKIASDISNQFTPYHISESLVTKRLKAVHDNGCEKIIIRADKWSNNTRMLEILQELKFKGPIIINYSSYHGNVLVGQKFDTLADTEQTDGGYRQFVNFLNEIKANNKIYLPILFYGIDEPNIISGTNRTEFESHKVRVDNIIKALNEVYVSALPTNILREVTTSATKATFDTLASEGEQYKTNYPIFNYRDSNFLQLSANLRSGSATINGRGAFYFQGYNEIRNSGGMQNINRYLGGIGMAKSGFKGYMINPTYGYSGLAGRPFYDDFTTSETNGNWHKNMLIFFPASDGFIPTLQSEGWRDGILDLRYYITYQNAVRDKANITQDIADQLATLESSINTQLERYSPTIQAYKLPSGLTNKDLEDTRERIKQYLTIYYNAGETPNLGTPTTDLVVPHGLSTFGENETITTDTFSKAGMTLLEFDGINNKWNKIMPSQDPYKTTPGRAFYIYNENPDITIKLPSGGGGQGDLNTLSPGWNLLWNSKVASMSDLKVNIQSESSANCALKNISLEDMVNNNFIHTNIFAIVNDRTSNAQEAFKLLSGASANVQSSLGSISVLPEQKAYWVYLYPSATNFVLMSKYPQNICQQ